MTIVFVETDSYKPGEAKGTKQERAYTAENEEESRPKRHISSRVDERESGGYNDGCREVR